MTAALEEVATVVAVDGDFVLLEVERGGGCGACTLKGSCGVSALSSAFGRREVQLRLRNTLGALPGEKVLLSIEEGAVARGSATVYAVPLVGLVADACPGHWLGTRFGLSLDGMAAVGGLFGLLLGAALAWWIGKSGRGDARFEPVLSRRFPG